MISFLMATVIAKPRINNGIVVSVVMLAGANVSAGTI